MEYIELFTAYRSEEGDLEIVVADTDISRFCILLPNRFWKDVIKTFEELRNSENYSHFEKSDRDKLDNVISVIKEELIKRG